MPAIARDNTEVFQREQLYLNRIQKRLALKKFEIEIIRYCIIFERI